MQTTDYNQQAQDFLAKHGIGFRATLSDSKTPQWADGDKHGHHYRVTLSRPIAHAYSKAAGMKANTASSRLTFDFWNSIADAEKLLVAAKELQDIQLQIQNTEPHLRINLRELLSEREQAVAECHPTAYDVLACISGDIHCPESFEEFCSEYGYESDSIKALQTFRRCLSFSKRLKAFFTKQEIEEISEIQ